ncbi:dimethyl sulfoxide reductase anchor subunit family protein [Ramlibacter sp.]|uniref:dimethyl sulfoxide reductase anchor subunit family protein n=1 Tax=Ramlibacter sp. TaxID=1917967 RepID=UPI003D10C7E9
MKPAASIILFTTLAGAAQGMCVVAAGATLAGAAPGPAAAMLWTAVALLVAALVASFFHLGHPQRAWRTVLMWRTSWMSREVIVLPAFIALVALWATMPASRLLAALAILGAFALWYCTAMIYACIRFIQEWAHPLTAVNYVTLGLASGCIVAGAVSVLAGDVAFARAIAGWAIAALWLAWLTRTLSLRRNARLVPRSTIQSATGIQAARVVQTAMGMTGGSFNTREFFHGATAHAIGNVKAGFQILAFAVPLVLLAWAAATGASAAWLLALVAHALGMLAERWFFFAQARHPQNLYYQAVS